MALITNPPSPPPAGLKEAIEHAGHAVSHAPEGWLVDDAAAVQAIISAYSGSATELGYWQRRRQAELVIEYERRTDPLVIADGATDTSVTAATLGGYQAACVNNYRSLKAQIAAATTASGLQAINPLSGWPAFP
jgi:hypothetical protein